MMDNRTRQHLEMEELERVALGEGALPAPRREHLDGCARCRDELASLETLHQQLSTLPYQEPSPGLADAVVSRVPHLSAPWYVRVLSGDWAPWAGFSAGAVALSAIGFWIWLFTASGVAVQPVLTVALEWARAALWDVVVGAGQLLYDSGLGPAAAELVASMTPGTAAALLAVLAVLGSLASVTVFKLMELPVPALGSARRT